ncbi:hypothetical protein AVEN_153918-1 [Araneus ventricosus]|uniref:Uncharacterized protein n=1 Tax=Araneus ventricosus TaxID=182803 RepID=A0A4Y2F9E8_ARAVE|nr:hypothetical protein AVEN_153918-1 [Araneus ventricosus]
MDLFPSKDGVARLVKLKTAKGYLLRPVQHLYPLEITKDSKQFIAESSPIVVDNGQPERNTCKSIPVQTRYGRVVKPLDRFQP